MSYPHVEDGDLFLFNDPLVGGSSGWQEENLGVGVSPKNTYLLPGRIGIIAGQYGITVYRHAGTYTQN